MLSKVSKQDSQVIDNKDLSSIVDDYQDENEIEKTGFSDGGSGGISQDLETPVKGGGKQKVPREFAKKGEKHEVPGDDQKEEFVQARDSTHSESSEKTDTKQTFNKLKNERKRKHEEIF